MVRQQVIAVFYHRKAMMIIAPSTPKQTANHSRPTADERGAGQLLIGIDPEGVIAYIETLQEYTSTSSHASTREPPKAEFIHN